MDNLEWFGALALIVGVMGFLIKWPGAVLMQLGILTVLGSIFLGAMGDMLTVAFAMMGAFGGLLLIGFGKLIDTASNLLEETKRLRFETKRLRSDLARPPAQEPSEPERGELAKPGNPNFSGRRIARLAEGKGARQRKSRSPPLWRLSAWTLNRIAGLR